MKSELSYQATLGPRVGAAAAGGARLGLRLLAGLALLAALLLHGAPVAHAAGEPEAPTVHTINRLHQGLTVYWDAPTSDGGATITGYDVQYKLPDAAQWTGVAHTGTVRMATIAGLDFDTAYTVRVRAVNSNGAGEWSSGDNAATRPDDGLPDPPERPTVTASDWQLVVSWTAPSYAGGSDTTIKGYHVHYRADGVGSPVYWEPAGRRLITATSTTITGLTNDEDYEVWVSAVNSADAAGGLSPAGEGAPNADAGRCSLPGVIPPGRPAFASATWVEDGILFRWDAVPPGGGLVTDYTIYVTTSDDQTVSEVMVSGHELASAPYEATVSGLAEGTTYKASMRARNILGCYSGFSDVVTVAPVS